MLRTDFQRIFRSKRFWLAVLAVMAAMAGTAWYLLTTDMAYVLDSVAFGLEPGFHETAMYQLLTHRYFLMVLTLLASLPFAPSLAEERTTGRGIHVAVRTLWSRYLFGRCMSIALSTFLAVVLGLALSFGVLTLVTLPMELASQTPPMSQMTTLLGMILRCGIACMVFALTGTLASLAVRGAWGAYVFPSILWIGLYELNVRYLPDIFCLNFLEWIQPMNVWLGGSWGVLLFLAEILGILGISVYLVGKGAFLHRRVCTAKEGK